MTEVGWWRANLSFFCFFAEVCKKHNFLFEFPLFWLLHFFFICSTGHFGVREFANMFANSRTFWVGDKSGLMVNIRVEGEGERERERERTREVCFFRVCVFFSTVFCRVDGQY